jgi:hypothetical protein
MGKDAHRWARMHTDGQRCAQMGTEWATMATDGHGMGDDGHGWAQMGEEWAGNSKKCRDGCRWVVI